MTYSENFIETECPVARALSVVGDKWSLMIIRDAFDGIRRFSDFRKSTGAAKNILTSRLKELTEAGVFMLKPASDGSAYKEYVLTEKGIALFPVIISLRQWGEETMFEAGETHSILLDGETGKNLQKIQVRNSSGKAINPFESIRKRAIKSATRTSKPQ